MIVFLGLLAFYTYKVLSNAGRLAVRPSSAQADVAKAGALRAVELSKSFELPSSGAELEVKAFESMSISIVEGTPGDNVELVLSGEGQRYLGDGSQLSHWLKVQVGGNRMRIFSAVSQEKKVWNF